jgi:hypothetical protein
MIGRLLFLFNLLVGIQVAKCSEEHLAREAFLKEAVLYKAGQLCYSKKTQAGFKGFSTHLKESAKRARRYLHDKRENEADFMPTPAHVELYASYMCKYNIFPTGKLPRIPEDFQVVSDFIEL